MCDQRQHLVPRGGRRRKTDIVSQDVICTATTCDDARTPATNVFMPFLALLCPLSSRFVVPVVLWYIDLYSLARPVAANHKLVVVRDRLDTCNGKLASPRVTYRRFLHQRQHHVPRRARRSKPRNHVIIRLFFCVLSLQRRICVPGRRLGGLLSVLPATVYLETGTRPSQDNMLVKFSYSNIDSYYRPHILAVVVAASNRNPYTYFLVKESLHAQVCRQIRGEQHKIYNVMTACLQTINPTHTYNISS